jgi:plasmid maintenance system antidote protein VapI
MGRFALLSNGRTGTVPKRPRTVCDQLRDAIRATGKTHYRIGKDAGIKPEIVTRFVSGQRDITGKTFAKLAAALGLTLVSAGERKD